MQSLINRNFIFPMLAIVLPLLIILLLALKLAVHSWQVKHKVKDVSFAGLLGRAESDVSETGLIFVRGELWYACSKTPIQKGEIVRVIGSRNLQLEVEAEFNCSLAQMKTKKLGDRQK